MRTTRIVLAAEDDPADALLLRLAFEKARSPCQLFHVRDGKIAVDYLSGNHGYADRAQNPLPDLLLLDLNMPRMGGLDVLKWLRQKHTFDLLPRIVLSSSPEQEIAKARNLGACACYSKPTAFSDLVRLVLELETQWLGIPKRGLDFVIGQATRSGDIYSQRISQERSGEAAR